MSPKGNKKSLLSKKAQESVVRIKPDTYNAGNLQQVFLLSNAGNLQQVFLLSNTGNLHQVFLLRKAGNLANAGSPDNSAGRGTLTFLSSLTNK